MATVKNTKRTVTARAISGHSASNPYSATSGVAALDPSSQVGKQLASRQPNTDRRRFFVGGGRRGG